MPAPSVSSPTNTQRRKTIIDSAPSRDCVEAGGSEPATRRRRYAMEPLALALQPDQAFHCRCLERGRQLRMERAKFGPTDPIVQLGQAELRCICLRLRGSRSLTHFSTALFRAERAPSPGLTFHRFHTCLSPRSPRHIAEVVAYELFSLKNCCVHVRFSANTKPHRDRHLVAFDVQLPFPRSGGGRLTSGSEFQFGHAVNMTLQAWASNPSNIRMTFVVVS